MEKAGHKKQRREIPIIILVLGSVCFMILGMVLGYLWGKQCAMAKEDILQYKVVEQNLSVQSILWKDYPAYRELSFTINGTVSFDTTPNGTITLKHLAESDMLEETDRERHVFTNGSGLQYYDEVTYCLNEGRVMVHLPKVSQSNVIQSLTDNSYYLTFCDTNKEYIAGSIRVLDTVYEPWTEEQIKSAEINLSAYLPVFVLSNTYDSTQPLHQKTTKEEIHLIIETADGLTYTIQNNTNDDWNFEGQLPHIELWYKGIWIEFVSPFDSNAVLRTIAPSETQRFEIPNETMKQYSTLFPGIYRLVLYGEENGAYIVSEPSFYEGVK